MQPPLPPPNPQTPSLFPSYLSSVAYSMPPRSETMTSIISWSLKLPAEVKCVWDRWDGMGTQ
jgi:hypothetical protein